uniref:Uncharacterized protein n=1 Tax=viral metagenome TaxID=1070528 RepID=A0A6C0H9A6_9ZZZZ
MINNTLFNKRLFDNTKLKITITINKILLLFLEKLKYFGMESSLISLKIIINNNK